MSQINKPTISRGKRIAAMVSELNVTKNEGMQFNIVSTIEECITECIIT